MYVLVNMIVSLLWAATSIRDHFVNAPSQWEMTLHCNSVSQWTGAFTKWSQSIVLPNDDMASYWVCIQMQSRFVYKTLTTTEKCNWLIVLTASKCKAPITTVIERKLHTSSAWLSLERAQKSTHNLILSHNKDYFWYCFKMIPCLSCQIPWFVHIIADIQTLICKLQHDVIWQLCLM